MKFLLEAMRLLHYMLGITAPKPEDERKVLLLWISVGAFIIGGGIVFVYFLVPSIFR